LPQVSPAGTIPLFRVPLIPGTASGSLRRPAQEPCFAPPHPRHPLNWCHASCCACSPPDIQFTCRKCPFPQSACTFLPVDTDSQIHPPCPPCDSIRPLAHATTYRACASRRHLPYNTCRTAKRPLCTTCPGPRGSAPLLTNAVVVLLTSPINMSCARNIFKLSAAQFAPPTARATGHPSNGGNATAFRSALQVWRQTYSQRETPACGFRTMPAGGRYARSHSARARCSGPRSNLYDQG
jgi:hypothetical protein